MLANFSFAQGVRGVITGKDRIPVAGATVQNLTRDIHVHTNENGFFSLQSANIGDSILVTHIAHESRRIKIDAQELQVVLEAAVFQLENVLVEPRLRPLNILSEIDLRTNPVNSAQEILRRVPGLFIGQHAGGGKAEQIFLRGFDIDHGTDISINVDGMPVNMVSHAHGQGYADLHFLIPETIEKIDFDKGPYIASKGNFTTAGFVDFQTRERLDESAISVERGMFNTFRGLGMLNLLNNEREAAWAAMEYLQTDGFFESPQNFKRLNIMGKYTRNISMTEKLSLSFSHLTSQWDASGQIPQRAVDRGLISRFGAIDDTEGGNTGRTNFNLQYQKQLNEKTALRSQLFLNRYDFELYSNFTFFLEDPVNGDQIKQKEDRNIFGFRSDIQHDLFLGNIPISLSAGIGVRYDDIDNNELSHTLNRKTLLDQLAFGDVDETNLNSYAQADFRMGRWSLNAGLRYDQFNFQYTDRLSNLYSSEAVQKGILSPKLNLIYNQDQKIQYFLKLGKGFHSNDTRVVVARRGQEILPAAYGADAGIIFKPVPRMVINAAAWYLFSQQEFVYVGDAGIVEPSGRSERKGVDLGLRYQIGRNLFFNGDATFTQARAMDEAKGEDYIPLAPKFTFAGGLAYKQTDGINAAIRVRYLGDRPANEDNSLIAKGYFVTDLNLSYQWKRISAGIIIENLSDTEWNETQFETETRLRNEPSPVSEIHFTPGTPFNLRGVLRYSF